jgi:cytochrome c biogenesis protein CcdA
MDASGRGAALAALLIFGGFGLVAYFMPAIMLAVGEWSGIAAGAVALLFVAAFFGVFWLRARQQRARDAAEGR